MDLLALILLPIILAAATGVYLLERRSRSRDVTGWLEDARRTRILVQMTDSTTLDGSIARIDRDGLLLEPARYLDGDRDLAGAVWIPRERIAWIQQP